MARTPLTLIGVPLALAFLLSARVAPVHAEVSADQAAADRATIVGAPFVELKETLERSFPREEALEHWVHTIATQYASVWYVLVANYENKLVYTWYRTDAQPYAPALQTAFRNIKKFTMTEGAVVQEVGGHRLLVTREKLVIEMDTYYFELGFGPIR